MRCRSKVVKFELSVGFSAEEFSLDVRVELLEGNSLMVVTSNGVNDVQ